SMNQVGLNSQIVVEEFSGMGGVRENAADFGRGEKHEVRALFGKKVCDGGLVAQIKLRAGGGKNTLATTALELPKEGRPHQSAVSGYISAARGCQSHGEGPIIARPCTPPLAEVFALRRHSRSLPISRRGQRRFSPGRAWANGHPDGARDPAPQHARELR